MTVTSNWGPCLSLSVLFSLNYPFKMYVRLCHSSTQNPLMSHHFTRSKSQNSYKANIYRASSSTPTPTIIIFLTASTQLQRAGVSALYCLFYGWVVIWILHYLKFLLFFNVCWSLLIVDCFLTEITFQLSWESYTGSKEFYVVSYQGHPQPRITFDVNSLAWAFLDPGYISESKTNIKYNLVVINSQESFSLKNIYYLFILRCQVLVAACGI